MFDCSGPTFRPVRDDATVTTEPRPVEYVVRKDGKPFAILNATPTLASRTVSGFALAAPDAAWTFEPV